MENRKKLKERGFEYLVQVLLEVDDKDKSNH